MGTTLADPDQILDQYEGRLAEAQRKSDALRERLANLRVVERSADGQIAVTVNDAGNLVDLKLGNSLQRREGDSEESTKFHDWKDKAKDGGGWRTWRDLRAEEQEKQEERRKEANG